jgi:hypothetical protein
MRDPFVDMTFKELDALHKGEVARMEAAVNSKEFALAADIEKKVIVFATTPPTKLTANVHVCIAIFPTANLSKRLWSPNAP